MRIDGFNVRTQTWDNAWQTDGQGDEVFYQNRVQVVAPDGSVKLTSDRSLFPDGRSVMGDTNNFPSRIQAGKASAQGGLISGDPFDQPFVLWEPTYDLVKGGDRLSFTLSLWEWDGGGDAVTPWLSLLNQNIQQVGKVVSLFTGAAGTPFVEAGTLGVDILYQADQAGILGDSGDRPIGMVSDGNGKYKYDPKMLILDYDRADQLSRTDFGLGAGVMEVGLKDDNKLAGDYVLRVSVHRVP